MWLGFAGRMLLTLALLVTGSNALRTTPAHSHSELSPTEAIPNRFFHSATTSITSSTSTSASARSQEFRQKYCAILNAGQELDQKTIIALSSRAAMHVGADTDPKYVQQIYQILKDLSELCQKHHVTYWAEGGTLLGAVRDGGLIKWDDDGDIGVPIAEEGKFTALKSELTNLGYGLHKWYYGYKVYYLNGQVIPDQACEGGVKPFKYPFLDIFIVDESSGKTFYPRSDLWPSCYFSLKDLYPLKPCKFGPITLMCAAKPEPYLDECYKDGGDWRTHGMTGKDHVTYNNEQNSAPFALQGSALVLPPEPLQDRVN